MFNVIKSASPPTPFLFSDENVVQLVKDDFFEKCYLCEENVPRHLEVEHFYPQAHFPLKINDWDNLISICQKCNKIRPKNVNTLGEEVYNPCSDDVDSFIKLKLNADLTIDISYTDATTPKNINTVTLLDRIHNGIGTASLSYKDLRKLIAKELANFNLAIENYYQVSIKDGYKEVLSDFLSKKSQFTAFKRWIIRDDVKLNAEFNALFD